MSQKPTVGRAVHFHHSRIVEGAAAGPYAATVTAVNDDGRPSLAVFGRSHLFFRQEVRHRDDPARPVAADFWDWPPRA